MLAGVFHSNCPPTPKLIACTPFEMAVLSMFAGNRNWRLPKWLSRFCYLKLPAMVPEKVKLSERQPVGVERHDTSSTRLHQGLQGALETGTTSLMIGEMFHLFITFNPPTYTVCLKLFLVVSLPLCPSLVFSKAHSLHFSHFFLLLF